MTRPLNSDPLRNFKFQVTINHSNLTTLARLGFMAVSGLAVQNEVIPYREGGNNTTTRKMPGQSDFGPISLTRGAMAVPVSTTATTANTGTNEAYQWLTQIFSVQAGAGATFGGPGVNFRFPMTIDVMEHPITTGPYAAGIDTAYPIKARFQVYNCWPMGLSYSDLEAGGNAVFIENLTLANEGWSLITRTNDPGDFVPYSVFAG